MEKIKNQLGIYSWYGFDLPLHKRLAHIREAGFDATMIWWGDEVAFWYADKEEIPALVRDSGLYLENIHVPYIHCNLLWSHSENERKGMLDSYYGWIEDCANYHIPTMVMHVTDGDKFLRPTLDGLKCMDALVCRAEEYGVRIAVENTKNDHVLNHVLKEIPSHSLGLCYDSSHSRVCSQNQTALLELYKDRLFAVHLSDNDGLEDRHWLPGTGVIDWDAVLSAFPVSYGGCISLEVFTQNPGLEGSSEAYLRKAYGAAVDLRKKLRG